MRPALAMAQIRRDLDRHRKLLDLRVNSLGEDLCKAATDGVQRSIAAEQSPDGNAWPALSEKYEERKSFDFPGNPMAVLRGTMANPREVAGEVVVTEGSAEVTFGTSAEARQEASWFQEGDSDQPPRPFWGFTPDSEAEARAILDKRFSTL